MMQGQKAETFYKIRQWFFVTFINRRMSMPKIDGFTNGFWKFEIKYKNRVIFGGSIAQILYQHMKTYNLFDGANLVAGDCPDVYLILPTGARTVFPMVTKNFEQNTFKTENEGLCQDKEPNENQKPNATA
jgi:hypothetical protein